MFSPVMGGTIASAISQSHSKSGPRKSPIKFSEQSLEKRKKLYAILNRKGSLGSCVPVICEPRTGSELDEVPHAVEEDKNQNENMDEEVEEDGDSEDNPWSGCQRRKKHIKFLCSRENDITVGRLLFMLRKQLDERIDASRGLHLFTQNDVFLHGRENVIAVYDKHKNEDGFLYLTFDLEATFG